VSAQREARWLAEFADRDRATAELGERVSALERWRWSMPSLAVLLALASLTVSIIWMVRST
jgi:hypothetical protein